MSLQGFMSCVLMTLLCHAAATATDNSQTTHGKTDEARSFGVVLSIVAVAGALFAYLGRSGIGTPVVMVGGNISSKQDIPKESSQKHKKRNKVQNQLDGTEDPLLDEGDGVAVKAEASKKPTLVTPKSRTEATQTPRPTLTMRIGISPSGTSGTSGTVATLTSPSDQSNQLALVDSESACKQRFRSDSWDGAAEERLLASMGYEWGSLSPTVDHGGNAIEPQKRSKKAKKGKKSSSREIQDSSLPPMPVLSKQQRQKMAVVVEQKRRERQKKFAQFVSKKCGASF